MLIDDGHFDHKAHSNQSFDLHSFHLFELSSYRMTDKMKNFFFIYNHTKIRLWKN